jgi:hypothetical protein
MAVSHGGNLTSLVWAAKELDMGNRETTRSERLTLAVSQKVPDFIHSHVPEALGGISSDTITRIPPSTVLLLMAHPGLCELEEAARDANVVCLQLLDPRLPPQKIGGAIEDVIFLGTSRDEILFRAARALERREPRLSPPRALPELHDDGLRWEDRFVPLSATEVRITRRLLEDADRLVSRSELNRVIGHCVSERRAVEAHLYRLRHKLQPIPVLELRTIRQRGYQLHLKPADEPVSRPDLDGHWITT